MKAIVCTKYGSSEVLQLKEVEKPQPKDNEILIKIHATTVESGDCKLRSFQCSPLLWLPMRIALGITKPRKDILGMTLTGVVEAIGKKVVRFKVGDQILASTGMHFGAYAEYACLPEDGLIVTKPTEFTYVEAASIPFGGKSALYFLRKAKIAKDQKVLIYGASGSVGTSAVQLAKYFGADVTGVCSAANFELVKSLGAERVIDYTRENFAEGDEQYDIIFDAVGKITKEFCGNALASHGVFVSVESQGIVKAELRDMFFLNSLVETGKIKPVIDRIYTLEQIPEAHRYVEKGHKKGTVVIVVD